MSLLTFARKDPSNGVSVIGSVRSINRLLERQFPDCTCSVLVAAEPDTASEWVTIELEITRESLACLDWYRKQAEAHRLMLTDWKPRSNVLEFDLVPGFL